MIARQTLTPHWKDDIGRVRVLAVAEGYVMARRPRAMPFVMSLSEFTRKFQPIRPTP